MAKVKHVQLLRGTSAENNNYTGLQGELTVDLDTKDLRLHDDSTAGGVRVATSDNIHTILAIAVKRDFSATDSTAASINPYSVQTLNGLFPYSIINQNTTPKIDLIPTKNSANAVSSNGVYDELYSLNLNKASKDHVHKLRMETVDGVRTLVENGNIEGLHIVATTGSYIDLADKPIVLDTIVGPASTEYANLAVSSLAIYNALLGKADTQHTHSYTDIVDFAENIPQVTDEFNPNDSVYATSGKAVQDGINRYKAIVDQEFHNVLHLDGGVVTGVVNFSNNRPTVKENGSNVNVALVSDLPHQTDILPQQATHANELLTTDGSSPRWATISTFFSETELASIQSGINSEKINTFENHMNNTTVHVTATERATWNNLITEIGTKQNLLTPEQLLAVNSEITPELVDGFITHKNDTIVHITSAERDEWNSKTKLTEQQLNTINTVPESYSVLSGSILNLASVVQEIYPKVLTNADRASLDEIENSIAYVQGLESEQGKAYSLVLNETIARSLQNAEDIVLLKNFKDMVDSGIFISKDTLQNTYNPSDTENPISGAGVADALSDYLLKTGGTVSGNLTVNGNTSLKNLTVSNTSTLKTLTVSGNSTFSGSTSFANIPTVKVGNNNVTMALVTDIVPCKVPDVSPGTNGMYLYNDGATISWKDLDVPIIIGSFDETNLLDETQLSALNSTVTSVWKESVDSAISSININLNDFALKGDTLASYGIVNAYTKSETYSQTEVDARISSDITDAKDEIYDELEAIFANWNDEHQSEIEEPTEP